MEALDPEPTPASTPQPGAELEAEASVAPEPEPEPALDLDGLAFEARAKPIRHQGHWKLRLELRATSTTERTFELSSGPTPHVDGVVHHRDGEQTEFGDGCWSGGSEELDPYLVPGRTMVFARVMDSHDLSLYERGDRVVLHVGLCHIGFDDGAWGTVKGPYVHVELTSDGRLRARVEPAPLSDIR